MYVHEQMSYQDPGDPWHGARAIATAVKHADVNRSDRPITVTETARIIGVTPAVWRTMRREGGRLNSRTIESIIRAAWHNGYDLEVHMSYSGVRASARPHPIDVG